MKSRDRRAERMSEFVTNMFQYNVTVGITRSEGFFFFNKTSVCLNLSFFQGPAEWRKVSTPGASRWAVISACPESWREPGNKTSIGCH